jgi:alkylglycerol monooxygenase
MSIIQASIPLFFALIGLELAYARVQGRRLLAFHDSITDLSLGTLSQLAGVLFKVFTLGIYAWVAEHARVQLFTPVPSWPSASPFFADANVLGFAVRPLELASWTVVFVLVDFAYYWLHRCSHEVHVLWAGHVVHHSSEEYNLAVALRQSALHGLFSWVFYIPLALAGIPWQMFVACNALNLVYQFWIHTRAVGRLGWVTELVMNTPSHHRVHHGVNPKYQDKNYAGVFITWDRMFGTFVREEEEPVYGITHQLASWNPLWANVHVFVEIWRLARRTRGWRNKLRVVFGSPSWRPDDVGPSIVPPEVTVDNYAKFDTVVPGAVNWYALAQFVVILAAAVKVLAMAGSLSWLENAALVFHLALGLTTIGGLLEGERWGALVEQARLASLLVAGVLLLGYTTAPWLPVAAACGWIVVSMGWVHAATRRPAPVAA